jgi:hypothetical protein
MNFFKKWFQDHLGLIRLGLLLFFGPNLFSAERMFSVSPLLALARIVVALVTQGRKCLLFWQTFFDQGVEVA